MAGKEGLGRVFNYGHTLDNVYVNLQPAGAVTFVGYLAAGDTFTLTEATSTGGAGAQVLATVTRYFTADPAGAGDWTVNTQAAASTVVTTGDEVVLFTVRGEELSAGYTHVKVASTSTGTVSAILHDLNEMRTPSELPAVSA